MKPILSRFYHAIDLALFYVKEVLISNLKVALDVLTPRHMMKPSFLRIPVGDLTTRQICAANNLISMTPGTLCADYDESTKELLVHSMYAENPEEHEALIQNTYLTKIKNVF